MNNYMNKISKFVFGACIFGACYLIGCESSVNNTRTDKNNKNTVTYPDADTLVTITLDSARNVNSARITNIDLEPGKILWNNTKLIGKDEGFINHSKYKGDGEIGLTYVYGEYLFQNPLGEEITLFGKEETLFVGQNYNIEFYKITPSQNISAEKILEVFNIKRSAFQSIHSDKENIGKNLEGYLSKYTRVTK
jgi:hypothetical protein